MTHAFQQINTQTQADPFWALRGKAIAAYASVEHSLCHLFCDFAGLELYVGMTIYFRITAPRIMWEILEVLIRRKYNDTYREFWKSLDKHVKKLVDIRNHIVHGVVATEIDANGYGGVSLVSHKWVSQETSEQKEIRSQEIEAFIAKCNFIYRHCNMFHLFLQPSVFSTWPSEQQQTWRDIFRQPIVYPPPNSHPLFQKPKAPENQPPLPPASPLPKGPTQS